MMKPHYVLLLLACFAGHAVAQTESQDNEIERILVSSDFRQQQLDQLSTSISVIDQSLIALRQAQHLEQILNLAPNVNFASGASRGRFVQIRGIGERSQFSEPINPSVGLLIDEVDFSGIAVIATLFDVQQVEIVRGPQPTEFGASALAGVVKLKTQDPSADPQGRLLLGFAGKNTYELGAAYGNGLGDKWQYRVALHQYTSDGFIDNIHLNQATDDLDESTARIKLRYQASANSQWDVSYQRFDIDNGYDAFSLDNDGKTRSDQPGFDRQLTDAFSIQSKNQYDWGQLTVIMTHADSQLDYGYDEDWTYVGFHPNGYSSTDYYSRDKDSQSAEIRLVSADASRLFSQSTHWVLGMYAKQSDEQLLRQYTFSAQDFTSSYQPDNMAFYVQTDTALSADLSLKLGLRLDDFSLSYQDNSGFAQTSDDTILGGKIALEHRLENTSLYASVARGYKAGGFNPDQRVNQAQRLFEPEFNWNYEFGVKGRFKDNSGYLRMAAFYMEREDTQVSDFAVLNRDNGSVEFIDIIANADTGRAKGLELETAIQLSANIRLAMSLGWLDTVFGGFERADGTLVAKQALAHAPEYTANIAADIDLSERWHFRIETDSKDNFRFSDGHDELSEAYTLVNASLNYHHLNWHVSLWTTNLTDKTYYVRGFGGFSNDPRDGEFGYAFAEPYYQLGDGRQAGLSVSFAF